MSAKKKPIMIIVAVVVLALLGGGGYFAYLKLQAQTDENTKNLEAAGDVLVGDAYKPKEDKLSEEQMRPTIDTKVKPSRKVVKSLQRENVKLSVEIIRLKDQIESLNSEIADLEEYKSTNERFAPKRIQDEMADIERQVKAFLLESEDAERFSTVQIEIMAAASALEYKEYIMRNRLMVTKVQRAKMAVEFLPGYSFCIGDGIVLAANNSYEFDLVASKFRGAVSLVLPRQLKKDLDSVVTPCQNTLRSQLDKQLSEAS
ncbi:MAG: hypothetical protein HRU06_20935 [Oceanospirillaceae bacterium]|nr:hypothetical protein [Oceanospirillaceae bacterium]